MRRIVLPVCVLCAAAALAWRGSAPVQAAEGVVFYPGISIRFEPLTIDNGLSHNVVYAMLQDQFGYIWIGTQDGLNRFDGYGFVQFRNDPDNPRSISHNSILSLYEDTEGFLWVGTWGGGLNRYDPQTGEFTRFQPDPNNPMSLSDGAVTSIAQDRDGRLWVGTLGGLNLMETFDGVFRRFRSDAADPATLRSDAISVITPDSTGRLWIGTGAFGIPGGGLDRFDPDTLRAERIDSNTVCLQSPNISAILADQDGSLWVGHGGQGLPGGGLDHYTPATDSCDRFDTTNTRGQFTSNNVSHLMFDRDHRLWIGLWGGGILRLETGAPAAFTHLQHDATNPESLASDNVNALIQDRSGVLWVGTGSVGVSKLNLKNLQFRTYKHILADRSSLAGNYISAFAQAANGSMWIGTRETGLARFEPVLGQFNAFRFQANNPNSLSSDLITALYPDTGGSLWVGTQGGGLNRLDVANSIFRRYRHDPVDPASLPSDDVIAVTQDSTGRMWVATPAGLSRLEPGGNGFVHYRVFPDTISSLMARGDYLWIGTQGGGVSRLKVTTPESLSPVTAEFTIWIHLPAESNSLSDDNVWAIYQTADGILWFGTDRGLNRFDPVEGTFHVYTEQDGLRNASIRGITEDSNGDLWVTTNNGLSRFTPPDGAFRTFDKSDGLAGNEFTPGTCYTEPIGGYIFVGGTDGFTVFHPLQISENSTPPQVAITGFRVFNTPFDYDPHGDQLLSLDYNQNFISFDFAALDYHSAARNTYAYKLDGFDTDWVESGTRHFASYTNLPGGEYTFRVRAANGDGVWSDQDAILRLEITPPFWQRWQFQLIAAGALAGAVLVGFQWRVREIRDNARRLESEVRQRTAELRETNVQLAKEVEQRKRAEAELARHAAEALQQSEERFRAVFENAAVGVAVMTLDQCIEQVNDTTARLTGHTAGQLLGRPFLELAVEEDRRLGQDCFSEMVQGSRGSYMSELRFLREGGELFWGRVNFSTVRDPDGRPLYVIGILEDITEEKRSAERLANQEAEHRRMLERRIAERTSELNKANELLSDKAAQDAVAVERTRLARDLHDAVTQTLFSATLIADVLPELWARSHEEGVRRLEQLRQLTRGALAEMRTMLVELRPNALVEVPLPTLLRQLAEAMAGRSRIRINVEIDGERTLPSDVQVGLYRIVQESLNNVLRHSKAERAQVCLSLGETVRLTITDDGVGFDPNAVGPGHLGLRIMRERAESIGARWHISHEPGEGTIVSVSWGS